MLNRLLRWFGCCAAVLVLMPAAWLSGDEQRWRGDPFQFFAPWVVISDAERQRLEQDEVVVQMLHGDDGQIAVFVATRLNAPPDALVAWTRAIGELKRSQFVLAIGRFSDPPTPADLADLRLDERDLQAIRECVPGACGLKLSASEIESLRAVAASGGSRWRQAVQDEFRRLLVARIDTYRAGGLAALAPNADGEESRQYAQAFMSLVAKSPYLERLPAIATWLQNYPRSRDSHVESFFYWSKEHYGGGKPVISITHVGIMRPGPNHHLPAILISGKQIFATHYLEGGLGLTMVMRDSTNGVPYLVYLNRSQLDLLRGFFSGFARGLLESRLRRQAPQVVGGLRMRLESGNPPDETDIFPPTD